MNKGKLLIISGFSGAGKGTVMGALLDKYPNYKLSISATTRNPRPGEEDKVHYFFITKEEFEQLIDEDQLLEYAKYVDNYYGTPVKFVKENLEMGNNVILEIESQGALKVKEKMPEAEMIFLMPPSADELKRRLVGRGSETAEQISKRLAKAAEETENVKYYEYKIVNYEVDDCAQNINKIATDNNPEIASEDFVEQLIKDIKKFSKGE